MCQPADTCHVGQCTEEIPDVSRHVRDATQKKRKRLEDAEASRERARVRLADGGEHLTSLEGRVAELLRMRQVLVCRHPAYHARLLSHDVSSVRHSESASVSSCVWPHQYHPYAQLFSRTGLLDKPARTILVPHRLVME